MSNTEIADVWREYQETRDVEVRNRLVVQYAPLVKYVAGRVRSGLPDTVETADLVSEGIFGLVDAIDRYDPDRGLTFQAYAVTRIRGAMLDALRAQAWVPRQLRDKMRVIERAHEVLQGRLGRVPTEAEVSAETSIPIRALRAAYSKMSYSSVAALDDLIVVDEGPTPGGALEDDEVRAMLVGHVRELRERDQVIVALYYYEGFTFSEIGQVLGVTESRVSQLHTRAMLNLRAVLRTSSALS